MNASERIRLARESREEARLLSLERMGSKAVLSKLYHAMMQSLFALLRIRDIGRQTHADLIDRFERAYVTTGAIDGSVLDALRRSYDLTHECDCDRMPLPTDEEIAAAERAAEVLIERAVALLGQEVSKRGGSVVRQE